MVGELRFAEVFMRERKFPISECPHCGSDEIYVKATYSGNCDYHMKLDGSLEAYNGEMYDYATMKIRSKYAFCSDCDRKLFKLSYDMYI